MRLLDCTVTNFNWRVSYIVVVLTCFVMWGVCVCVGFVMCGCFINMYTCIYCVLFCFYCVFFTRLCIFILIYFVCTSVRATATD